METAATTVAVLRFALYSTENTVWLEATQVTQARYIDSQNHKIYRDMSDPNPNPYQRYYAVSLSHVYACVHAPMASIHIRYMYMYMSVYIISRCISGDHRSDPVMCPCGMS